jgi:hypothetical protein
MLHRKKVKGKWQYFDGDAQITEYEYILKTEAELEQEEIEAPVEALADAQEEQEER